MSTSERYEPKHRAPGAHKAPRATLRSSLALSTMAVVATGLAVSGGAMAGLGGGPAVTAGLSPAANAAATVPDPARIAADIQAATSARNDVVTRSDRRVAADPVKADALAIGDSTIDNALTRTEDLADEDPRVVAKALLAEFGFSADQFGCLDSLWTRESNWRVNADNPRSSAYGIPQALPGSKMSSAGADWATNPVTQIRWGLGYIEDRYGSPCGAWSHSQSRGWY